MVDKSLFGRLQRLFSTQVVVRRIGKGKTRAIDTQRLQSQGNIKGTSYYDRYGRLHTSRQNWETYNNQYNYSSNRMELYTDYEAMDKDSIIASVLDIYSDECLGPDTVIPLLNGKKYTIKELYENDVRNFWVYGLSNDGNFVPSLAERVIYKGKKQTYILTLDDGTKITATDNHIFVKSDNSQVQLKDLKVDDGLLVLQTKRSNSKSIKDYELIKNSSGKFDYTHRVVSKVIPQLINERVQLNTKDVQIHHIDFNKYNNDPTNLTILTRQNHIELHASFNKEMWSFRKKNPYWMQWFRNKVKECHGEYWSDERRNVVSARQRLFMNNFIKSTTFEQRREIFANFGEKNGMFGKGYKLFGEKNGRYNPSLVRFEQLDLNEVENFIFNNYNGSSKDSLEKKIISKYGVTPAEFNKLCKFICTKYNIASIQSFPRIKSYIEYKNKLSEIREYCNTYEISWRKMNKVAQHFNIPNRKFRFLMQESGYGNFTNFLQTNNHKIISIELGQITDVYDIVNVGDNHLFAIETNDGGKCYVHNCTLKNDVGDVLRINSDDENIKKILYNLFYDVLNIEFNLWAWIRGMNKYGDYYLDLDIQEGVGIVNASPISAYEVEREEGFNPENPFEVRFKMTNFGGGSTGFNYQKSQNDPKNYIPFYRIAHFRLFSDTNFLPYGRSLLEPARKSWKQLTLMEDAMLIHRIMRAPEKRIFKVDVGNIPPTEVDQHMRNIIDNTKKTAFLDQNTGDYNLKFNLQNMLEDYYLPVRGGQSGTEIETLNGMEFTGIDDINYLKNRMMAALKVPKAFIGYEEAVEGKATLAQQDIRFARSIERVQKIVLSELTKIAVIHLYAQGYENEDLANFTLDLTPPSIIYQQEKVALWVENVRLATDIKTSKMLSQEWIYKNVFNMSDDEWKAEQQKVIDDLKLGFRQAQIENEGNDPVKTGESFGTPHDMAYMNRMPAEQPPAGADGGEEAPPQTDDNQVVPENLGGSPKGGWPGAGRPKKGSSIGTDRSNFGRNPLGYEKNISPESPYHNYRKSPLSIENLQLQSNLKSYKVKTKEILMESLEIGEKKQEVGMLDEKNILNDMV